MEKWQHGQPTSRLGRHDGIPGRFIISAHGAQIVADASPALGGPGEAFVAQELYFASIATCALAVIDMQARAQLLEPSVHVGAESDIDGTRYRSVTLEFRFTGVGQAQAEALVAAFTDVCPIYNTLARTTPVTITVVAARA